MTEGRNERRPCASIPLFASSFACQAQRQEDIGRENIRRARSRGKQVSKYARPASLIRPWTTPPIGVPGGCVYVLSQQHFRDASTPPRFTFAVHSASTGPAARPPTFRLSSLVSENNASCMPAARSVTGAWRGREARKAARASHVQAGDSCGRYNRNNESINKERKRHASGMKVST